MPDKTRQTDGLANFLAGLQACSRATLVARWTESFRQPPTPTLSAQLLRSGVAYELQAAQDGALNRRTKEELIRLKNSLSAKPARRPRPGAQLMREWNGIAHIVDIIDIIDDGFHYRGKTYRSLTAIAFEITGARWSGPRFFGLKSRASK